jgi:hypothetical protein
VDDTQYFHDAVTCHSVYNQVPRTSYPVFSLNVISTAFNMITLDAWHTRYLVRSSGRRIFSNVLDSLIEKAIIAVGNDLSPLSGALNLNANERIFRSFCQAIMH